MTEHSAATDSFVDFLRSGMDASPSDVVALIARIDAEVRARKEAEDALYDLTGGRGIDDMKLFRSDLTQGRIERIAALEAERDDWHTVADRRCRRIIELEAELAEAKERAEALQRGHALKDAEHAEYEQDWKTGEVSDGE